MAPTAPIFVLDPHIIGGINKVPNVLTKASA